MLYLKHILYGRPEILEYLGQGLADFLCRQLDSKYFVFGGICSLL